MWKNSGVVSAFSCLILLLCLELPVNCVLGGLNYEGTGPGSVGTVARLVKKEERTPVLSTEFGAISSVDIEDGTGRHSYHLQFITLEPNSLFLPVLLHADMVFYVQTGSGKLSWTDGDDLKKVSLQRGDVYRLRSGSLLYLHSSLESERPRFRLIAIFANLDEEQLQGPSIGPYSSINDLVRGFDKRVLQAAFQVPEEVIEELTSATDTPAIVHAEPKRKNFFWEEDFRFVDAILEMQRYSFHISENKKKHTKTFNFFKEDPDFENCNGWSKVVTKHDLHALHGSDIGIFMVNLTKGSMMGPHWNPAATEVSVILEGEGMVRVVCPSALTNKDCKNSMFRVEEGDVFTVPRFHPMAQTSFNNGSLVFMGFSTTSKRNHPQFLAGKASVLQTLDKLIIAASFNVANTTIDQLLAAQDESIILDCTSCAEGQEMLMEEEIEIERQKEERKREEEEAKRREEEEGKRRKEEERRRQEEEERRREKEEERRRKEEERRRQEEEERKRKEEEEQRRREEEQEEQRRREEEEQRQREEEQRRHEEEEEEQRRQEEEEEVARQREEEQRRQEEEEQRRREEEQQRKQEEVERQREEEQRRQEEEEQRRREEEEEEEQRKQEEEEEVERQREEEQRRQEEEEQRRREEEEQRKQEEEEEVERQREEEERQRQEEEQRQQEEEEEAPREEREQRRREEEWRRREGRGRGEEESEGEIARREEEERVERAREAEEAARRRRVPRTTLKALRDSW